PHSAPHRPNMNAAASGFDLRCSGDIVQLNVAAGGFGFDLAIALGDLYRSAAGLQRHHLGPADVQVPATRLRRNMSRRRHQPYTSASDRSLNIISHLANV